MNNRGLLLFWHGWAFWALVVVLAGVLVLSLIHAQVARRLRRGRAAAGAGEWLWPCDLADLCLVRTTRATAS